MRLLIADDDAALRALLRTTFEVVDVEVEEAATAEAALEAVVRERPDAIVLDFRFPGMSGIELCRRLKADEATTDIAIVLLSGSVDDTAVAHDSAPMRTCESRSARWSCSTSSSGSRVGWPPCRPRPAPRARPRTGSSSSSTRATSGTSSRSSEDSASSSQNAYKETVAALASALESKDTGTRAHSQRVQHYALELAGARWAPTLVEDPSVEYGFLLHDVGKIGIPDRILQKPGPLNGGEPG